MCYIDADGVLADFRGWVRSYGEEYLENDDKTSELMVREYKKCFLESKTFYETRVFFSNLKFCPGYCVLTAIPKMEKLCRFCNGDMEKAKKIADTMRENKYTWFERRGVPRHKVIIVEGSEGKFPYCKPGDVLFDDKKSTVDKWCELGGQGIYVPTTDLELDLPVKTAETSTAPCHKNYKIGDVGPGGGYVFYDKGTYSDGWRYIEAAPENILCFGSLAIVGGGTSREIGMGKANTELTYSLAENGDGDYAEAACKNYCHNGLSDWFLPSLDELNLMLKNLKMRGIGGKWCEKTFAPDGEDGEIIPSLLNSLYGSSTALSDKEYLARESYKSYQEPVPALDNINGLSFTWLLNFTTGDFAYSGEQVIFAYEEEFGIVVRPARYF